MRVNLKKLIVETQSGTKLGKVFDVILDTNTQAVLRYEVHGGLLSNNKYLIGVNQAIKFEEEKMVVEDTVKPIEVEKNAESVQQVQNNPAMMREE